MINGSAGVVGHNILTGTKSWTVTDGGLEDCGITGNLVYSPEGPTPTYGSVVVTLSMNQTGIVLSTGRTATGAVDASGWSTTREKEYLRNIPGEPVLFQNAYEYIGSVPLKINRMITTYP